MDYSLSKIDIARVIIPNLLSTAVNEFTSSSPNWKKALSNSLMMSSLSLIEILSKNKLKDFVNKSLNNLNQDYLLSRLNKLGYKEKRDYTIGDKNSNVTIHLSNGILIISINKSSKELYLVENFIKKFNTKITNMENFSLISCYPNSKDQLDKILLGLFKILRKINIYNEDQKIYSDRINYNMIRFRDYRKFSDVVSDLNIKKLVDTLDDKRIYDYGVDNIIPSNSISVNYNPSDLVINVPNSIEYIQDDIDDYVRTINPGFRIVPTKDRNITRLRVKGKLTQSQSVRLIQKLIELDDYVVICPKSN